MRFNFLDIEVNDQKEIFWLRDGKLFYYSVVQHPRICNAWLATWRPVNYTDCGMKRYKTRSGAIKRVMKEAKITGCTLSLVKLSAPVVF